MIGQTIHGVVSGFVPSSIPSKRRSERVQVVPWSACGRRLVLIQSNSVTSCPSHCPELPSRFRCFLLLVALLVSWAGIALELRGQSVREHELQAAFLYNFLTFTQWPEAAFDDAEAPFVIGILGDSPVADILEQMAEGDRVNGRPWTVRRDFRLEDIPSCHVLFVGEGQRWRLGRVLQASRRGPVLTVADIPGFADRGGIVEFRREEAYVRLGINRRSANQVGLHLSSRLLQLADLVGEPDPNL